MDNRELLRACSAQGIYFQSCNSGRWVSSEPVTLEDLQAVVASIAASDSSHLAAQPVAYLVESDEKRMLDPQLLWADELCPVSYKDRVTHPLYASSHLAAPTDEDRSGSGVPARPTLPGELPVTLAPLPDCHCEACDPIQPTRVEGGEFVCPTNLRMIVCAICGNKRCPHATDHRLACTNSNDSGQPGSSYSASKAVFVERALAASPLPQEGRMPKLRDVGRRDEMSHDGWLRVLFDGDGDLIVAVYGGGGEEGYPSVSVEFCTCGTGGGRSPRTREALIALMVAMEADNAESPSRAHPAIAGTQGEQKP